MAIQIGMAAGESGAAASHERVDVFAGSHLAFLSQALMFERCIKGRFSGPGRDEE